VLFAIKHLCHALQTALCKDAKLHTAGVIVVLWPSAKTYLRDEELIRIGLHHYSVQFLYYRPNKRNSDVLIFAFDVEPSDESDVEFEDFCISLLAGFEWELRSALDQPYHLETGGLLFENQGLPAIVWTAQTVERIFFVLANHNRDEGGEKLIITDRTITPELDRLSRKQEIDLVHYSEIGKISWLNDL
jgi:hypothetical protein